MLLVLYFHKANINNILHIQYVLEEKDLEGQSNDQLDFHTCSQRNGLYYALILCESILTTIYFLVTYIGIRVEKKYQQTEGSNRISSSVHFLFYTI